MDERQQPSELARVMSMIGTPQAGRLADALRRAAVHPRAPRRLHRAADAVLDGKFSWEEVVQGRCTHPYAMSLFTRGAEREMWPQVLHLVTKMARPRVK